MSSQFFKPLTSRHSGHLRYRAWKTDDQAHRRGLIILQGGRTESYEKYCEVIDELRERRFDVVSMDWRGQGGSVRPLGDPHKGHIDTFDSYLHDFHGFLRQLGDDYNPDTTIFMGHSMGGNILTRYIQAHPSSAAGLVLSAPMFSYRVGPIGWDSVSRLATAVDLSMGAERYAPTQGKFHWRRPEAFFRFNGVTSCRERFERNMDFWKKDPSIILGGVTNGWLHEAARSCDILLQPQELNKITCPVLIVSGKRDHVVGLREHRHAASHIRDVKHLVVHGARHEILMETDDVRNAFWRAFDEHVTYL